MSKSDYVPMVAPLDIGSVAYFIMFYEGMGNLFPWNAFITASSYYAQRFCGTSFEDTFENYFSITYTLSQTIGLGLAIVYGDRLTLNQKVSIPLAFYSTIFGITTMLVAIQDINPTLLFYVTLLSAFASGSCGALLSSGLFGLGAMLPPAYTGALMNGQGLAGLVVSVSAMLTQLAASPIDTCSDDGDDGDCVNTLNYSALAYFLIATFVLVFCIFAFMTLKRLAFTRYYMARAMGEGDDDVLNPILSEPAEERISDQHQQQPMRIGDDSISSLSSAPSERPPLSMTEIIATIKKVAIPAVTVWLTFAVTIGLFPALTVLIESTESCKNPSNRFQNDLFTPFMFLLFNIFDLVGRLLAGMVPAQRLYLTDKTIWMAAVARFLFFPAFLLCNIGDSQLPTVFNHDAFPFLFMIFMALTNGYVASSCMMMGPSLVDVQQQGLAGTIMVFCLTAGLMTGASLSFVSVVISQGSV